MTHFTDREREIIQFVVTKSLSNKQIAEEIGVSVPTVKTHMSNIFRKVGFNNRRQLGLLFRKET